MGLFDGKKGLILGVANDYSIAWAISQKLLAEGAELGFTHLPGDKMERRVRKLADPAGARLVTPCDVQKDEDVARVFDEARETYGTLDFVLHSIAFAPIDDIKCPFVNASREGFKTAMEISVYSLAVVARNAAESMPNGGSIVTLTYFGGERVVQGYNMMGVCKAALDMSVRTSPTTSAPRRSGSTPSRPGRSRHSRRRRSATPTSLPACTRRFRRWVGTSPARRSARPACSCFRPCQRDHRRDPPRRLRLQHHGLSRPGHRGGPRRQVDLIRATRAQRPS